jgi:hypothetical protein
VFVGGDIRDGRDVNVTGPSWAAGLLAAVMIVTAVYCATRLAAAWRWRRPTEYDADGAHVFMGVAMAGMLVPRLDLFPHGGWEVIFGAAAAWFGWRAARAHAGQRGWLAGRYRTGPPRPRRSAGGQPADGLQPAGQPGDGLQPAGQPGDGLQPAGQPGDGLQPAGRSAGGPQARPSAGALHPASHHAHHLLACGAMLYMLLAVSAGSAGMSAAAMARTVGAVAGPPPLTLGLALVLFTGVLWAAERLVSPAPTAVAVAGVAPTGPGGIRVARATGNLAAGVAGIRVARAGGNRAAGAAGAAEGERPTRAGRPMSPRLAASCEIVMGLTMGYMLITMV